MKTYNTRFRSIEKLKDFLFLRDIDKKSTLLVQVFSGKIDPKEITKLTDILKTLLPNSIILGASTDGEMVEGRVLKDNIVLSISVFESTTIDIGVIDFEDNNYFDSANTLANKIIKDDTKALILFASAPTINADELMRGINSHKKDIVIAGALAGDNGNFQNSYVFSSQNITNNGMVAVALSGENLIANVNYSFNCEPVGREFTITKSSKNRVYEVNNTPIAKLYEKYLGKQLASKLPLSGSLFPFVIKKKDGFIARSCINDPKDGTFIFGGNLDEGEVVQIAFTDMDTIVQKSNELFKEVTQNSIESVFIFSSNVRRRFLPSIGNYEAEIFEQIAPSCGFFSYGEFFGDKNECRFLNQSTTVLTLSESKNKINKAFQIKNSTKDVDLNYEIIKALSNIAKVSSNELQELNKELESKVELEVRKNIKKDAIMIHTSRLAQMGEMMSLIAHQWRQPLSAISATSSGLAIRIELDRYDPKFFLENLHKIEHYITHLSTTIDDFANFFKPTKAKESVYVKDIIKKAFFILSPSIAKNSIAINKTYNSKNKVKTYPNEVVQVLINLMKNSENILVKRKIENPTIEIVEYEKHSKHIIEISDNGGGIDDKIMGKIFAPYFSTKNTEKSTGLGLYMSKFIIESSCGGIISVENTKNGAKFTIIL